MAISLVPSGSEFLVFFFSALRYALATLHFLSVGEEA